MNYFWDHLPPKEDIARHLAEGEALRATMSALKGRDDALAVGLKRVYGKMYLNLGNSLKQIRGVSKDERLQPNPFST